MIDTARLSEVAVDLGPTPGSDVTPIGVLARDKTVLRFEYRPEWLGSGDFLLLDPALGNFPGPQYPTAGRESFGLFDDISPDRWGRVLMRRREDLRAYREGRKPRSLTAWDFLLGVQDETRMGAVRLRKDRHEDYLNSSRQPVPPVTELRTLEAASRHLESAFESGDVDALDHWIGILVAPGSSLGGARPKCNFRMPDGSLWIAKFPARDDQYDVGLWEQVLIRLAATAGIATAPSQLHKFSHSFHTYCTRRFDREGNIRLPFASAMTFAGRTDGDPAGYLDIAQALDDHGTYQVKQEMEQLFRRLLFNLLVSNRDDHLRNHGFYVAGDGIRLTPVFDVNPAPEKATHAIAIDDTSSAPDLSLAMATADLYGLNRKRAGEILDQVRKSIAPWRETARGLGAKRTEMLAMEAAFPDN